MYDVCFSVDVDKTPTERQHSLHGSVIIHQQKDPVLRSRQENENKFTAIWTVI